MSQQVAPAFEEIPTEARTERSGGRPTGFTLAVVEGTERGKQLKFVEGQPLRVVIGKGATCDFCVRDSLVSRRHAAIEWDGASLEISDLDSTNGTTVNGISMAVATLRGDETIRLGGTSIRVVASEPVSGVRPCIATRFGRMIGASPAMRRIYPLCEKLATMDVPVIIQGETGTGKELLAECLHEMGPRAGAPFVVFDCAAAPSACLEATLFGEERDPAVPESEHRLGVFEQAHGGTLLLDEIDDLDPGIQLKILRAVERSEIQRVGSSRWVTVDVRVLATTKGDLDRKVRDGGFRADLFFRLAVARIEIPPVRDRMGDVALLCEHFARTLGGDVDEISAEVMRRFEDYGWPGNVRELLHAVARLRALREVTDLGATSTPLTPTQSEGTPRMRMGGDASDFLENVLELHLPLGRARQRVVAEFEKRYVQRVLVDHAGNITRAARASGIARRYFQLLRARKVDAG